jgi:hypothetical protein
MQNDTYPCGGYEADVELSCIPKVDSRGRHYDYRLPTSSFG